MKKKIYLMAGAVVLAAVCGTVFFLLSNQKQKIPVVAQAEETESIEESSSVPETESIVETETITESAVETESTEEAASTEAEEALYTVIAIDPVVRYAKADINVRDLPDKSGNKVDLLVQNTEVTVTGYVNSYNDKDCLWYEIKLDSVAGERAFVNGGLLVDAKVETTPASGTNTKPADSNEVVTQPPVNTGDTAGTGTASGAGNTTGTTEVEYGVYEGADPFGGVVESVEEKHGTTSLGLH